MCPGGQSLPIRRQLTRPAESNAAQLDATCENLDSICGVALTGEGPTPLAGRHSAYVLLQSLTFVYWNN
jgi:hypothetical protein